ncbi:hypothetical protein FI667_g12939, partial [Globisporangium splendens]
MPSDGDEPKGTKKGAKCVTLQAKDGSAGSDDGDAGNGDSEAKAFTGDMLAQPRSFEEGDAVLYQWPVPSSSSKEGTPWRSGVVKTCRSDGTFGIMDSTSDEVVKKVAASAMKKKAVSRTRKQQNVDDVAASDGDGQEEGDLLLAVDAAVEFKNKKGVWRRGHIHRVRKDGTFDVVHGEEDGDGEEVVKRLERKQIRKPKSKKSKASASGKDDSDDGKNSGNDSDMKSIRNRKGLAKSGSKKKKKQQDDDEDEERDEDTDSSDPLFGQKPRVSRSLPLLRINQMVQFPGSDPQARDGYRPCVARGAARGQGAVHTRVRALQRTTRVFQDHGDPGQYQRDRVLHRHLGHIMGGALLVSYLTLLVYASLLNRFGYYCLLSPQTTNTSSRSSNSMLQFDDAALQMDMFAVHSSYDTTVELLVGLAAKTTINLFRAMALHVLLFAFPVSSTAFLKRVLYAGPSIGIAAWLSAMAVAVLHVFYYVQKTETVVRRVLTQTRHGDWSVVLVTIWLNVSVYNLLTASGWYSEERRSALNARSGSKDQELTDDILDQAERGELGLQDKREVLLTKVERVQAELGVCKLSLVRLQSHALVHIVAMSLGIYADSTLRPSVAYERKSGVRVAVLHAMTFHLVMCILWLIVSVLASLYARTVKQEPRVAALWKYLLDV